MGFNVPQRPPPTPAKMRCRARAHRVRREVQVVHSEGEIRRDVQVVHSEGEMGSMVVAHGTGLRVKSYPFYGPYLAHMREVNGSEH
jgi:hypothetical protein